MDLRLVTLLILVGVKVTLANLKGDLISCKKEGQAVHPPPGADKCIKCECRNKQIKCWKPKCPGTDGCHVLLVFKPKSACCHVCRGCLYQGRELLNGESVASQDTCSVTTCRAGVVTVSTTKCHVPCTNPVTVRGQCCPVCPADDHTPRGDCFHDNRFVANGDVVPWKGDKCTSCTCIRGRLSCAKRACPVLNCPDSKIVKDDNECCAKCEGSRKERYPTNGDCIFRGQKIKNGLSAFPDKCTKCQCKDGSSVCEREVCPILNCPSHAVVYKKGACCPSCKEAASCPAGEESDGEEREHDEEWKKDACTTCHCYGGAVSCRTNTCPKQEETCPAGMMKIHPEGECCSRCVPLDSKCSISGSGSDSIQYTTFDDKNYKFNGVCKYTLVRDHLKSFSVRVQQGYETPTTFKVKKIQVAFKTRNDGYVTVTMDTRLVAKVNKTVVKSGYTMPQVFVFEKSNLTVSVTLLALKVKVSLSWDGYTEVIASRDWQENLSGLCGDYNGVAIDDLRGKDKKIHSNAEQFAETWRLGGHCTCDKKIPESERHAPCSTDPRKRLFARQRCDIFRGQEFSQCRKVLNYKPYYLTCLDNVCSCENSSGDCQCPTILAMEKQCNELGVRVNLPQNVCSTKTTSEGKEKSIDKPVVTKKTQKTKATEKHHKKSPKLHEEARFKESSLSKALKSRKPVEQTDNTKDIEKMKAELSKKHAKRQPKKPRGPESFLFG